MAVAMEGEAKAYPIHTLNHREMVIDYFGVVPVLVSWCPLCATGMAHRREVDGREIVLGNQGDLFGNAMTWWDHETGSVWSQPLGEAILGPLAGTRLELLASQVTEWDAWRDAHPDTVALDAPGLATSFDLDEMLIAVELGDEVRGYPVRGVGVDGPLAAEPLPSVPALTIFPDDFTTFFSDGEIAALGER